MSLILTLVLNTAVTTTPVKTETPKVEVKAGEVAKPSGCDTDKDKKVLGSDPKTAEQKSAEEKALQNLGLKKEEPKAKVDPVVTSAPAMETCK